MKFDQLTYTIREDTILLSPVIILSQPAPVTFTLTVNLIDSNTTAGKLLANYLVQILCLFTI